MQNLCIEWSKQSAFHTELTEQRIQPVRSSSASSSRNLFDTDTDCAKQRKEQKTTRSKHDASVISRYLQATRCKWGHGTLIFRTGRFYLTNTMRKELSKYRAEISGYTFTGNNSRKYWADAQASQKFPTLGKIARLFLTVPASAVPQERHFSELKRRSAGLKNRTKVETLDRDSVVHAWCNYSK